MEVHEEAEHRATPSSGCAVGFSAASSDRYQVSGVGSWPLAMNIFSKTSCGSRDSRRWSDARRRAGEHGDADAVERNLQSSAPCLRESESSDRSRPRLQVLKSPIRTSSVSIRSKAEMR